MPPVAKSTRPAPVRGDRITQSRIATERATHDKIEPVVFALLDPTLRTVPPFLPRTMLWAIPQFSVLQDGGYRVTTADLCPPWTGSGGIVTHVRFLHWPADRATTGCGPSAAIRPCVKVCFSKLAHHVVGADRSEAAGRGHVVSSAARRKSER